MTDDAMKLLEEARRYVDLKHGMPGEDCEACDLLARIDRCLATGGWIKGTSRYTPHPIWILTGDDVVCAKHKESDLGWWEYRLPPLPKKGE